MKKFSITTYKFSSAVCKCMQVLLQYYGLPNSLVDVPEIKYSFTRTIRLVKKILDV